MLAFSENRVFLGFDVRLRLKNYWFISLSELRAERVEKREAGSGKNNVGNTHHCRSRGTIPYFSKLFFRAKFSKFSKVDFGKVWKSLENLEKRRSISPKEHVFSGTIFPTISEHYFHTGVRRFDHGSGYNDDTIKKFKWARRPTRLSAGPVRYSPAPAQGRLRRRLQTQSGAQNAQRPSRRIDC